MAKLATSSIRVNASYSQITPKDTRLHRVLTLFLVHLDLSLSYAASLSWRELLIAKKASILPGPTVPETRKAYMYIVSIAADIGD